MTEVVIGTSPTTGEVLVKDTDTGDMYWAPGTEAQIASATAAIEATEWGAPYTPQAYQEPTPAPYVAPLPPPIVTFPSWDAILASIWGYLAAGVNAWNWVVNAPTNVWNIVDSWWSAKQWIVQGLIITAIQGVVSAGINAWNWVQNAFWNVWDIVDSWWSVKLWEVKGWISTAVQGLNTIAAAWTNFWNYTWPSRVSSFNNLKSSWDNFWSYTLPNLVSFSGLGNWWNSRLLEVQGLINSAVKDTAGMAEGWQDWRTKVAEFFSDPVEYVWKRFADWFLGPEG